MTYKVRIESENADFSDKSKYNHYPRGNATNSAEASESKGKEREEIFPNFKNDALLRIRAIKNLTNLEPLTKTTVKLPEVKRIHQDNLEREYNQVTEIVRIAARMSAISVVNIDEQFVSDYSL